jgi:hypothetical protein
MSTLIINEGVNPHTGIQTRTHFADGEIVVEKRWDAEPDVEYARLAREAQEGQRWGDGKFVVRLSAEAYGKVLLIRDPEEKKKFIKQWARENPAFVMFDKYLKV